MKRTAKYLQARAEGAARKAERRAAAKKAREARALEMIALYREGATLHDIGARYGITRERVRQLMTEFGVTGKNGGRCILAKRKKESAEQRKEAQFIQRHGVSRAEYFAVPARARRAFSQQRKNSAVRGIEWRMTICEWWDVWQKSGKWSQRGRGQGYCMGRKGDCGPYSVDNVYICTIGQNFSDSYIWKPAHMRKRSERGRLYEYEGRSLTLGQLARATGMRVGTLQARVRRGLSIEQAVKEPLWKNNTHLKRLAREQVSA